MGELQYYFCFRVLRPTGAWVVWGPYNTRDQAMAAREKAKAWDVEVGVPFEANSTAEAEERCNTGRTF